MRNWNILNLQKTTCLEKAPKVLAKCTTLVTTRHPSVHLLALKSKRESTVSLVKLSSHHSKASGWTKQRFDPRGKFSERSHTVHRLLPTKKGKQNNTKHVFRPPTKNKSKQNTHIKCQNSDNSILLTRNPAALNHLLNTNTPREMELDIQVAAASPMAAHVAFLTFSSAMGRRGIKNKQLLGF